MRDPVSRIDHKDAAAIEDTCRSLERYMRSEYWKADPDTLTVVPIHTTIDTVGGSNLPDWAKAIAISALLEQAKKRPAHKPTRHYRDDMIRFAAIRLVARGYMPTRNDVTRNRESASSLIHQALQRLGEKMSEKSINAIVMEFGPSYFTFHLGQNERVLK